MDHANNIDCSGFLGCNHESSKLTKWGVVAVQSCRVLNGTCGVFQ
ncbi:hypothetical protein OIU78_029325, partial [Salix suchowensis]